MDDLISRQALCEYALNQKDKCVTPNDIMRFPSAQPEVKGMTERKMIYLDDAIDAVEYWHGVDASEALGKVPSAQRKKGRWLDDQGKEKYVGYCAECSACGGWSEYITDFCPNCGADMRGENE